MNVARQLEKLAADNSPLILTGVGVAGTVTTALLTGRATIKAARLIDENLCRGNQDHPHPPTHPKMDAKEHLLLVWKLYVPPVASGVLTVTAIVVANRIGTRRAAAMTAAYALSERAFSEYKEKVIEKIGERKEQAVRDEVAQDQVNRNPSSETYVNKGTGGQVKCYEPFTGRYFWSDMETMKKAQNDLNYQVLNNYYASLSDFYDLLGLDRTQMSDDVGWNSDEMLEIMFTTTIDDEGKPCLVMNYKVVPIRGYCRVQ